MNIIKAEIRRLIKTFAIWAVVLVAVDLLFMSLFPSMKSSGMGELVKTKMSAIPKEMRESLGIGSFVDFSDILQYFAYCWQYILIALRIYSGILGANRLIKDESSGTIEFLYAKPVSRTKIACFKLTSITVTTVLLNIILFAFNLFLISFLRPKGYNFADGLIEITLTSLYLCTVFLAVGFAASSLLHNASQASPFALSIFFVTYIFGMLSSIMQNYKFLKYFSPYHYVIPSDILKSGTLKFSYAFILAVLILIGIIAGISVYRKKDFRI